MRKSLLTSLLALTVTAFPAAGVSLASGMGEEKVAVALPPAPNVQTAAKGEATFWLAKDGKTVHYKLHVENIENATMAHVHVVGEGGGPAAVITWLYPVTGNAPSLKEGKFSGAIAEGEITSESLAGAWKGKPVKDLFEEIEYGKAGVAVHTKQNPGGELWGTHKKMEHKGMMHKEMMHKDMEHGTMGGEKKGY